MPIPDVTDLDQTVSPLIYAKPTSEGDKRGGRYCTSSGFWAPARFIVYVDGAPYIKGWEPSSSAGAAARKIARYRKDLESPV